MSKAMELIVQVYVRHQNRRALEDLRKHRQELALELRARARPDHDLGTPTRQINEEIAVIEAGLERLVIAAKVAFQARTEGAKAGVLKSRTIPGGPVPRSQ
jgi:hypothetical protein